MRFEEDKRVLNTEFICCGKCIYLVADLIFVTHFSRVSLSVREIQCIQNSVANTCRYTSITPALKKLLWLPLKQHCVFKTLTLAYKILRTRFPRYFAPFLHLQKSPYNKRNQNAGSFLVVPIFQPSIHKSSKQFGYSFAFDAPSLWNDLPDDIRAAPSVTTFIRRFKYTFTTRHILH